MPLRRTPVLGILGLFYLCTLFEFGNHLVAQDDTVYTPPLMLPERQFAHEHVTNFTDVNHTHYMDPWGFDVLCNYKSNLDFHPLTSDSITLLTQMVLDDLREQRLLDLASRWSGFLSVAIYFSQNTVYKASTLEEAIQPIDRLRAKHSTTLRHVHFHIVVNTASRDIEYPHNFLRNIALNSAITDYVLLLDVDLIPPPNAHDSLLQKFKTMPELMSNEKALLILPAFERRLMGVEDPVKLTADDLPSTKASLLKQINDHPGMIKIFQEEEFEPCHGPTLFPLWYNTSQIYLVNYQFHFEPYYVIRKIPSLPPFWEHFTGFGRNKASWVEEIAAAGFQFYVSPEEFLVHIQHDYKNQMVSSRKTRKEILIENFKEFVPYVKKLHGMHIYDVTPPYVHRPKQNSSE